MSADRSANQFVAQIDLSIAKKLRTDLEEQGFEFTKPPYTVFAAKKKGVSCVLYESGKLMVQGKEMSAFMEFYIEPEILKSFIYTHAELNIDQNARIGIDESGKGDFFGPLCVAGVYAEGKAILHLKEIGVKDSKLLSDEAIHKVARQICAEYEHHIIKINPLRYNELQKQFGNLNLLLAWGHATAIEQLVKSTDCHNVIVDQFAAEHTVINALHKKKLEVQLAQRHRAEEDLVVAAASILARHAFLNSLEKMRVEFDMNFPKGASKATIEAGRKFVREYGVENLGKVAKLHFKTTNEVLS